jgi:hypothetical protein
MAMAEDVCPEDGGPVAQAPLRWKRTRKSVRYSPELAVRICRRVAAGEVLYAVCRSPGMPTAQSVGRWVRERPDFADALREARRAGGRPVRADGTSVGGVWTYCAEVADEIFARLCEGESLTAIGADPTLPCLSTIFYWRARIPEFEQAVQTGMRIRAERFCDLGWELASGATPETAYLTHVRLTQLRWTAGVMAPRVYRLKTVEPETPPRTVSVLMRRFEVEVDPVTGKQKVVAYCPNPETRQVEREDTPGWRPPGDQNMIPMPGGRGGR